MNVALVLPEFDPYRGGAENWTFQFARRLLRDGHRVHVVACRFGTEADRLAVVRHVVDVRRRWWRKDYLAFGKAARAVIRTLDVDVVHDMGHGWSFDLLQPHGGTRPGSLRQNLQIVPRRKRWLKRTGQSLLPRYRALQELGRRQFERPEPPGGGVAPRFVALSEMVRRDMLRYYRVGDDQIDVVYNGVDVDRFAPERCSPLRRRMRDELGLGSALVLLVIAHNFRLKGVGTAVRALARLVWTGRPVHLMIVGRDRPSPYARLAQRLGCHRSVSFHAAVPDPLPFYAAADVYVHPTYYDPCSLVALEALACGLPVVTSVHNGAAELISEGRDGFVLSDPSDDLSLFLRLEKLLDPVRRRTMGEAARRTATDHSLERNYRELLAVYQRIRKSKQRVGTRSLRGPHLEEVKRSAEAVNG